ncbi:MAG: TIGR00730 family Rossman fold protein [Bacteroidales bacterium]|nr:TIGR00730 family Rossman fold protein [Bacteroidales bacterium]
MNQIKTVCVYCASSTKIAPEYFEVATRLGELIGKKKLTLMNGGGKFGLMAATADAVVKNGGEAIGIIPQFMVDHGWDYDRMSKMVVVESMHQRKQMMADRSDAVIALPGGCGTWDELLEIITWKQLGLYANPIVIVNVDGYYDSLLAMFDKALEENFMGVRHADLWNVAQTAEEAMDLIYNIPLWDKSYSKFAAI